MSHLDPVAARRVFLLLSFTRWFPVGLTVAVLVLYQLDRGLSVPQALTASAISGVVVMLLELPTAGFADGFGRRPVYLAAAVVNVAASVVFLAARDFWMFAVAAALSGLFRALDSGPLEAWYVDTVHLTDPDADVDGALARQGVVLGTSIAAGSLLSGALIWWHPIGAISALTLPVIVCAVLTTVHLAAVLLLMHEPRHPETTAALARAWASVRGAPRVVVDGLGLLRSNRILRGLVLVELFWSVAMVIYESFQPIRLGELLGDEAQAGAWMGPVAAAGWAVFALGSALAGITARRIGVARTAIVVRVLNGLGVVAMGLVVGPIALIVAYLATYTLHGAGGPVHNALLHRQAEARNRATLLSINSMTAFAAFAVAAPLLGMLAAATTTQTAMVAAGAFSVFGALCYLPARRAERVVRHQVDLTAESPARLG
ncbi:MFS transporter [Nocardioides sp. BGMRC 2183]|nr:MFS transporter [Nocardioides sp. BGMRC 2183]